MTTRPCGMATASWSLPPPRMSMVPFGRAVKEGRSARGGRPDGPNVGTLPGAMTVWERLGRGEHGPHVRLGRESVAEKAVRGGVMSQRHLKERVDDGRCELVLARGRHGRVRRRGVLARRRAADDVEKSRRWPDE